MEKELPNSALEGSSAPSIQIQIPEILKEINKDIRAIKKLYKKYSIIIRKWFYFASDFTIYDGIEYVAVLYNKNKNLISGKEI